MHPGKENRTRRKHPAQPHGLHVCGGAPGREPRRRTLPRPVPAPPARSSRTATPGPAPGRMPGPRQPAPRLPAAKGLARHRRRPRRPPGRHRLDHRHGRLPDHRRTARTGYVPITRAGKTGNFTVPGCALSCSHGVSREQSASDRRPEPCHLPQGPPGPQPAGTPVRRRHRSLWPRRCPMHVNPTGLYSPTRHIRPHGPVARLRSPHRGPGPRPARGLTRRTPSPQPELSKFSGTRANRHLALSAGSAAADSKARKPTAPPPLQQNCSRSH